MVLDGTRLSLDQVASVAYDHERVEVATSAIERMRASQTIIQRIVREGETVYGVTTGFGRLSDVRIEEAELRQLQTNLVRSHACGVGPPLSEAEARAMVLLRANVLATGFSGARPEIAEALVGMLNARIWPYIPSRGSVGASGDLAPLAHLAMVVIGEGECLVHGERVEASRALRDAKIEPVVLEAKEGLALLNGTQAMAAVGGLALWRAMKLVRAADVTGAMSLEALMGTPVAFDERIHRVRPQRNQQAVAEHLCELLSESEIRESHRVGDARVQDAYSLRCMPQVHGAARSALDFAIEVVEIETGSATDNPLVFAETGEVLSGGNFHGAPLAHAFDFAAIALADLMSMSERRIERLVNPDLNEGLPPFLTEHPGVGSGLMVLQIVAAALLNEARGLAAPSSVDSVPTSGGKEDHVSMGMTGALRLVRSVESLAQILAIEAICAAQGLEFRLPLRPGRGVQRAYEWVRQRSPALGADRSMSAEIERLALTIAELDF
jgi:histidine ammonia-lyase